MCGRYFLKVNIDELLERYGILRSEIKLSAGDEIFPSQQVPVIIYQERPELELARWGFPASFQKRLLINARAETIGERKSFKGPFRNQRCLIPANAFFEWSTEGKNKIKHRIYLKEKEIFSLAGVYNLFPDQKGRMGINFVIITTEANKKIQPIHHRMPVILRQEDELDWLNPASEPEKLREILKPYPEDKVIIQREDGQLRLPF